MVLESADVVTPDHLPRELIHREKSILEVDGSEIQFPEEGISLEKVERELIVQALKKSGNNRAKAARLLSVGYDALRYKIGKYGLE